MGAACIPTREKPGWDQGPHYTELYQGISRVPWYSKAHSRQHRQTAEHARRDDAFALALLHDLDATVMILIWNLGMAALIAGVASAFGRTSLEWVATYVRPFHRGFPADDNYFPNREPFCGFGPS